jgi:histidyl-tRNA synthetase
MFRAEKPQRGRLRQFNQFGAELFGSDDPFHDYEVIAMMDSIAKTAGVTDYDILLNSIGCEECRPAYIAELTKYYTDKKDGLCEDCQRRLGKNPLRLLDCKNESCKKLRENSPKITSYLCGTCADHYAKVKEHLSNNGISFTEDPFLVRGLDYYTRTTFEFVTNALGGQNAFAAGGRYNKLVETFGGKPTPGVGFAAGIERMILITESVEKKAASIDAYMIHAGDAARAKAALLVSELRSKGFSADLDPSNVGMKSQMKKAERENARFALILGDQELEGGFVTVKELATGTQEQIPFSGLAAKLSV